MTSTNLTVGIAISTIRYLTALLLDRVHFSQPGDSLRLLDLFQAMPFHLARFVFIRQFVSLNRACIVAVDEFEGRRPVGLASAQDPIGAGDQDDSAEGDNAVVHIDCGCRIRCGPHEEDSGKQGPGDGGGITDIANDGGQLETAVFGEHATAAHHIDSGGDSIRDGEADDGSGDDGVEGVAGAEEDKREDGIPRETPDEPDHGDAKGRANASKMVAEGHAAIAR